MGRRVRADHVSTLVRRVICYQPTRAVVERGQDYKALTLNVSSRLPRDGSRLDAGARAVGRDTRALSSRHAMRGMRAAIAYGASG
jgi:hypothetical protein